jgi:hypothetical protein
VAAFARPKRKPSEARKNGLEKRRIDVWKMGPSNTIGLSTNLTLTDFLLRNGNTISEHPWLNLIFLLFSIFTLLLIFVTDICKKYRRILKERLSLNLRSNDEPDIVIQ